MARSYSKPPTPTKNQRKRGEKRGTASRDKADKQPESGTRGEMSLADAFARQFRENPVRKALLGKTGKTHADIDAWLVSTEGRNVRESLLGVFVAEHVTLAFLSLSKAVCKGNGSAIKLLLEATGATERLGVAGDRESKPDIQEGVQPLSNLEREILEGIREIFGTQNGVDHASRRSE